MVRERHALGMQSVHAGRMVAAAARAPHPLSPSLSQPAAPARPLPAANSHLFPPLCNRTHAPTPLAPRPHLQREAHVEEGA